ncbi:lytic transglycosylase domain-containing protein [Pontibaca methylaminivorans]
MVDVSDEKPAPVSSAPAAAPDRPRAEPVVYRDFSAKRIKPPAPGTTRRITVQIDPNEKPGPIIPRPEPEPWVESPLGPLSETPIGHYAWFWEQIPPGRARAGAGRLDAALSVLAASDRVRAPRLQQLQDIARTRGGDILRSTIGTRVSPALVLAVIAVESGGRSDAVSHAGAQGLMQLMPATARRFGVADSFVPESNIAGGVKYLDWLLGEFDNDPILALAGYNAGEGSVRSYGGVPPFAETRDYVPKVLAAFRVASGLCQTRPQLVSDGCVFVAMN